MNVYCWLHYYKILAVYCYSTIASLQHSLSESNKALDHLREVTEEERTKTSDYEVQLTRFSSELESLRESLHRKVSDFIMSLVYVVIV